ncbi:MULTISPECIES: threonine ammonia-lyase [Burkholderia]|uniref:threonine ammonia-lyase n=1 Tax=Burkholderia TaxID=32008 RepID=UPI0006799A08|nr:MULTISPECIES: threonine/serine dehydratase [Burkholderia]KWU25105.1 pyridoxal-5'-phosphate-dependent protein [Burkholderia cenocepacia]OXI70777.1 serine/threonine dehydratase [Burkholderia sp. AU31280]QRR17442.1 pyridoxal-phosphate dependent enzyme [Burkholderia sp. MS389]RQU29693.1 threonine/serine dehydratase [Burkholderia cenocepacia]RQV66103.1 threonine/serine dehydratase [Burkholderia cenocepacia]
MTDLSSGDFSVADIEAASVRILPFVVRTPLLESEVLNRATGARVLVKAESLQKTGSFKFRGACNRVLQIPAALRPRGVVAFSSGNHALAISAVCARFGMPATIIMPADAPKAKIEGARAYGATVRLYDRQTDDREAIGRDIAERTGAVTVPPYDDRQVMAGQGTVGLEIVQQTQALSVVPDVVLAAASGGGLVAGVATAINAYCRQARLYAVEPKGFDDHARSLAKGEQVTNAAGARSICDALQVASPGKLTFPINKRLLAGSLVVDDDEVRRAMRVAFETLKLVVEPGGAVPLAAVLAGKLAIAGKTVVLVLSGGNVDHDIFVSALA